MGYQDRWYNRENSGGGIGGWFRRMFSTSAGFFDWALPLFRVPDSVPGIGGIRVRIHLLYILIAVSQLAFASSRGGFSVGMKAAMLGTLFVLVLLHEFGHCVACRLVGGQADDILMWPLGGLAACQPPHRWKAHLITTLCGPGVNAALFPIFTAVLFATGATWGAVLYNPIRPDNEAIWGYVDGAAWRSILWSAHTMNLMLLVFNMAVPMFPMDAGRVVQEILWGRVGYAKSMLIASTLGLFIAVALGVYSLTSGVNNLLGIAVFGGFVCYNERQRARMYADENPWAQDVEAGPTFAERRAEKAAAKRRAAEQAARAEIDRILEKISQKGIQSLTEREKRALKNETDRSNS